MDKHKLTMRKVILGIAIGSTITALILQAILFHISTRKAIRSQNISEKEVSLENMQTELTKVIHDVTWEMLTIYNETEFVEALASDSTDQELRRDLYFWAGKTAQTHFDESHNLIATYVYTEDNALVSTYRVDAKNYPLDLYECEYDTNTEKIQEYLRSDRNSVMISSYYNEKAKCDVIRFALKLSVNKDRDEIGYLVCDYDSMLFSSIMEKYIWGDNVYIWLQPASDKVITGVGNTTDEEHEAYRQISKLYDNYYEYSSFDDEYNKYDLIMVSGNEKYNMDAFALVPQSLVITTQNAMFLNLLIISIGMMAVVTIIVLFTAKWLTRPVEEMCDSIYKIKNGETNLRVQPIGWSEELEVLGREFNEMLDKTQAMVRDEYEAKLLVERTEYKMLQAQINPHFLYNTLDTMRGIATVQNCPMVGELCQSLSAIFRYSLNMSDSMSTLQREMAHVRNYLYVMDVRNGNTIDFEYIVDDDTLYDQIPRITIQPIVENAINHGLRNVRRKDKKLIIKTEHYKGDLVVSIIDNGSGMDDEEINRELNDNESKRVEKGISIGMLNVNARLKNLFGDEYGLRVESKLGEGTTVFITVPKVVEEEDYSYGKAI